MREIKFRAFSRCLNVMMPIMTIRKLVEGDGRSVDYEDLIITQFAGLKDKNGVEIYEGDIIDGGVCFSRDVFGEIMYRHLSVVSFKDGCFVRTGLKHNTKSVNLQINIIEFEVIGNIYENSELLK